MEIVNNKKFSPTYARTRIERERDLALESELYLQGWSQAQIAQHISEIRPYSITQQAVCNDLKKIRNIWRDEYLKNTDELKSKELARIDKIEKELWLAWARSQQKEEVVESERTEDVQAGTSSGAANSTYTRSKVKRKESTRDGSMTFMQGIMWCVDERAKILGLNAPQKHEINWRAEAERAGVNPDELHSDLVDQFVKHAQKGYVESENNDSDQNS